jgi:small subunit ribosomal protein S17e
LGKVRQTYIKRTALEIVEKHRDELTLDFTKNRKLIENYIDTESKTLKNKIAGYTTHLLKTKITASEKNK